MILTIAIVAFIVLETGNVLILYFAPDSRLGNGVAVFNSWFAAQENEPMGEITPAGYSKTLLGMITGFQIMFVIAAIAGIVTL